ncbi:hypothetical protein [Desulfuromonas acetoxidans]|uniref:hypothetical protein n=1 Tax=Desulfuromonas acetoxidans TaxID=891 RepID=UPI00292F1400|nr:hypothetical protein [Desulfuromonas acetoxidans]
MDISQSEKKKLIRDLEKLAEEVLNLKNESVPRRPIVIEFCGSPKAGKSSCVNSLELFLRRNGFRTRLLTERASVCPISNKFDPYFNIWTVSSALAELVEILSNHPKDFDVVIMDRGVFDGLCWFNFLHKRGNLDRDNFECLEKFLLMNRLKAVIDLVYIFTASHEVSLDREYANLLTEKTGTIMQPAILDEFIEAIRTSEFKYKDSYQRIEIYDTSEKVQNEVSYEVTKNILEILKGNIEEKIGYFCVDKIINIEGGIIEFEELIKNKIDIRFESRDNIENDDRYVQPIPILVIKGKDDSSVLVVKKNKKRTSEQSPELGKLLLYLGGHVRKEDMYNSKGQDFLSIIKYALAREIKEEIGIDYHPLDDDKNIFCIWDRSNDKSRRHIAICFLLETNIDVLKIKLDRNEFVVGGATTSGKIVDAYRISENSDLEAWSRYILERIFNIKENQFSLY